jgi:hypothetical protein
MARGRGSGKAYRSARTGRYTTKAAAKRSPRTSVVESGSNKSSGKAYRSAISGRYVTKGTAQRHPSTTVTENG